MVFILIAVAYLIYVIASGCKQSRIYNDTKKLAERNSREILAKINSH